MKKDELLSDIQKISTPVQMDIRNEILNLCCEHLGGFNKKLEREVESMLYDVHQLYLKMVRTATESLLTGRNQENGWSVNLNTCKDFLDNYSEKIFEDEICDEVYEINKHLCNACEGAFQELAKMMISDYDELKEEHRFHTEHVEDCPECEAEYIDDSREIAGLHYDFIMSR